MIAVTAFRKTTTATSKRRRADTLFRQLIRERDGFSCQAAGLWGVECSGALEVAHFHPRRHLTVRWDPNNAALLCSLGHHRYADEHGDVKWFWIAARLGSERLGDLAERRALVWDKDYERVVGELVLLLNGRAE